MIETLLAAAAIQAAGASFDCRRASSDAERAICADPELARLDRELALRYVGARRLLARTPRAALEADQRRFLAARDEAYEMRGRLPEFADLAGRMRDRSDFLSALSRRAPQGLVGTWAKESGRVEVTQAGAGRVRVRINTAHPTNARWVCDVETTGRVASRTVEGPAQAEPGWRIRATLRDGVLHIEEIGHGAPGYCGANGSVAGAYLPVAQ